MQNSFQRRREKKLIKLYKSDCVVAKCICEKRKYAIINVLLREELTELYPTVIKNSQRSIPDNLVVSSLSTFTNTPYLLLLRPTSEPVGCFLLGTHLSFGIGDTVTPGSPPPPLLPVLKCLGVLFLRPLVLSQSSSQGPLTFFLHVPPFGNDSHPPYLESLLYKKKFAFHFQERPTFALFSITERNPKRTFAFMKQRKYQQ